MILLHRMKCGSKCSLPVHSHCHHIPVNNKLGIELDDNINTLLKFTK